MCIILLCTGTNVRDAYYYVNYNFRPFQFYFIAILSFRHVTPADRHAVEQVARALRDEFAKNIIVVTQRRRRQ